MSTETIIGSDASTVIGADIAMTLSSIAYCDDIPSAVSKYLPGWTVAWLPTKAIQGNLAFIAFNGVQYVVAIRGSILNFSWAAFDNWFKQDFNILEQTPWKYSKNTSTKPMISLGASEGLNNLLSLKNSSGETILAFLMEHAVKKRKFLCVTGHSLGANLSTVFAPWLLYQIQQAGQPVPGIFSVLTFAAPSAGNKAFAEQFDASFTNSWRFYNVIDIVPFSANNISGLGNLFPSPAPSAQSIYATYKGSKITLAEAFTAISLAIDLSEVYYGSYYSHTNANRGSEPLNANKKIFPVSSTDPLAAWFEQAGQQHSHVNYLNWMGAKPMTCTMTKNSST